MARCASCAPPTIRRPTYRAGVYVPGRGTILGNRHERYECAVEAARDMVKTEANYGYRAYGVVWRIGAGSRQDRVAWAEPGGPWTATQS